MNHVIVQRMSKSNTQILEPTQEQLDHLSQISSRQSWKTLKLMLVGGLLMIATTIGLMYLAIKYAVSFETMLLIALCTLMLLIPVSFIVAFFLNTPSKLEVEKQRFLRKIGWDGLASTIVLKV